MKKRNKIIIIILIICVAALLLSLPFIINAIYSAVFPDSTGQYNIGDLLAYYGSVAIAIGTGALSVATYFQSKESQRKTDEVNQLSLELQRKSMAMAEEQYKKEESGRGKEQQEHAPKFEITLAGYNGYYANVRLRFKNVSSSIISCLKPIDVEFRDSNDKVVGKSKTNSFEKRSLGSGEETALGTKIPDMRRVDNRGARTEPYKGVRLIVTFSCEDENSSTYYFRAILNVEHTGKYEKGLFDVARVG